MKKPLSILLVILVSLSFQFSFAQDAAITGKVIDEFGLPIESTTIIIQGQYKGVVSDVNGVYSISANPQDVLEFSFIGFKTQTIRVGAQTEINVTLIEDIESLDAVVVTGYQKIDRKLFTGSASTLKQSEVRLEGVAALQII